MTFTDRHRASDVIFCATKYWSCADSLAMNAVPGVQYVLEPTQRVFRTTAAAYLG